jgi:hypothetical protein
VPCTISKIVRGNQLRCFQAMISAAPALPQHRILGRNSTHMLHSAAQSCSHVADTQYACTCFHERMVAQKSRLHMFFSCYNQGMLHNCPGRR